MLPIPPSCKATPVHIAEPRRKVARREATRRLPEGIEKVQVVACRRRKADSYQMVLHRPIETTQLIGSWPTAARLIQYVQGGSGDGLEAYKFT